MDWHVEVTTLNTAIMDLGIWGKREALEPWGEVTVRGMSIV